MGWCWSGVGLGLGWARQEGKTASGALLFWDSVRVRLVLVLRRRSDTDSLECVWMASSSSGAGDLKKWVDEQLMQLMGYSKALVSQYVIRLAKDASSPDDLAAKLLDYGFSASHHTRSFATALFTRLPRSQASAAALTPYQQHEREAAKLVRKQMTYKLLQPQPQPEPDDHPHQDAPAPHPPNSSSSSTKKRFRKKTHATDDDHHDAEACLFNAIISSFILITTSHFHSILCYVAIGNCGRTTTR